MLPTLEELETAAEIVYRSIPATPQYQWPLLNQKLGVDLWLKHENHTPVGAFKVRGGLTYFDEHHSRLAKTAGVICATRGNHGQSIAFAAGQHNIPVTIVVPEGNSSEKNAAMEALGAKLITHGEDFQASLEFAERFGIQEGLSMVPSFDPLLVSGVATYSLELFRAVANIDVLYVPIGLGSGICGVLAARNALELQTEVVGVVSDQAQAYAKSFEAKQAVESPASTRIADGMACRKPQELALPIICEQVSRIVQVSDDEVEQAMRDIYFATHNVAEGAGAAAVAAVTKDASKLEGKRVAAVLCGGNVDASVFASVLGAG
ncbi:MAG: threonine dehydratase [Planctomycetota bacterium]